MAQQSSPVSAVDEGIDYKGLGGDGEGYRRGLCIYCGDGHTDV